MKCGGEYIGPSVGPCPTPLCSTNTLGGRGGEIEGEKREYRDVAYSTKKENEKATE
jgi:hypothetical protein